MADVKDGMIFEIPEETPEEAARLDAEAEADVAAGRVVPHAEVVAWLNSLGTDHELPCPEPKPR